MSCRLSPSAAAFSTMLSAFVGSVINGLSSGAAIAFITGWISWFSVLRILVAGLFELRLTIKAGTDFESVDQQYHSVEMTGMPPAGVATPNATYENYPIDAESQRDTLLHSPQQNHLPSPGKSSWFTTPRKVPAMGVLDRSITFTGWLGWVWSALYTPISQSIWVGVHLSTPSSSADGIQQFVRALAIGVSALGLTFDYKQRYAAALGRRWGRWAFVAFNAWNAGACLLLGAEAFVLLVHGAVNIKDVPIPLVVVYPIFSIIWAAGSWAILPPVDGGRSGNVIAGVLMGAFAGLFVAAPSFALWRNARWDEDVAGFKGETAPGGLDLGAFLACESASVWAKFAAIMP